MKKKIVAVILISIAFLLTLTSCDSLLQGVADNLGLTQTLEPQFAASPDSPETSLSAEVAGSPQDAGLGGSAQDSPTPDTGDQWSPFPYEFSGKDLYGSDVTQDSLGEKEVYFVHFWGTWCPPCIAEMPDLGELEAAYGDRVGFLALVDDFSDNLAGVIKTVESAGITEAFIMIDAYERSAAEIFELVQSGYVPTTVIVSNGEIIGPLVGAYYYEGYAEILDLLLDG